MTDVETRSSAPGSTVPPSSCANVLAQPALVTKILAHLSIASLRQAAGVSLQFYDCAWKAGLYIHRDIMFGRQESCTDELAAFKALVQHALPKKQLRLSLSFAWTTSLMHDALAMDFDRKSYPPLHDIATAITSALPLLVYLSIHVSGFSVMSAPFYSRMPRLEHLVIWCTPSRYSYTSQFPLSFFLTDARMPELRTLELGNATIGAPLRAFAKVTSLKYTWDDILPDQSFAQHFPKLAHLVLISSSDVDPGHALRDNLQGLSLHSLAVEGVRMSSMRRHLLLDSIPVVRLDCDKLVWLDPAADSSTDYSLRLSDRLDERENAQLSVIVVPAHRRWRRTYHVDGWTLPLAAKPGGIAHLTYLRLENTFLHAFLSCGAAFPALKAIHVDFWSDRDTLVWPPDSLEGADKSLSTFDGSESAYSVTCPSLAEVTLFAVDERVSGVESRQVAFLGRALGQVARPAAEKARLSLVGVQFAMPEEGTLLGLTFSAVNPCAFSGRRSEKDYDGGLWEEMA